VHSHAPAVEIVKCHRSRPVECGFVTVPLDRHDDSLGTIHVFFERYTHSDTSDPPLEPIVAIEGGPGYSTTADRSEYLPLFGPLMDRRDLILIDLRGTGRSDPIDCKPLQAYRGSYERDVGKCGRQLGPAANLYGTHVAAEDVADVLAALGIRKIDLYGDSYGTFFSQTFAVRYPGLVRTVILDSAYSAQWPDPWYADTNPAMVDGFRLACERWPACPATDGMVPILQLLTAVRAHPISGRAFDSDGHSHLVTVDAGGIGQLMSDAATNPEIYRELDAAALAAIGPHPDTRPLLRLMAENTWWGTGGPVREWSEGLYNAVGCHDYPQPYDMARPYGDRITEYRAAIRGLEKNSPNIFWPFTVKEWVHYPEEYWDECLRWPVISHPDPPVPPHVVYPEVPVLVLSGDLDSLTSPQGALATAAHFPDSTFVSVANSTHVTAIDDYGRCASEIVLHFVETRTAGDISCASQYAPYHVVNGFARRAAQLGVPGILERTAVAAADTVADVQGRWWTILKTHGVGLRGGTFTMRGYSDVRATLTDVRFVSNVRVSGSLEWDRRTGEVTATVTVDGPGASPGTLMMSWNDWAQGSQATVTGTLGGQQVSFSFLAP
jgi:pimeloyl-ACP methyl ester carboxylesterase